MHRPEIAGDGSAVGGAGRTFVTAVALASAAALVVVAVLPSHADVIDPTIAKTIAIGDGNAISPTERGSGGRTGRIAALPSGATRRWQRSLGGRVDYPPVVAADGSVIVLSAMNGKGGFEGVLNDLSPVDGAARATTRLGDVSAAPPILLGNGLRVVVTSKGDAIGVDATGAVRFRTALGNGAYATVAKVGLVPLASGGFAVARGRDEQGELIEVDGSGGVIGRVRLQVTPILASRSNGDVVAIAPSGELYTWRAGRVPHLVGTFGEKGTVTSSGQVCPYGPVVDGDANATSGARKERVLCVLGTETLIEQIDMATGARHALLGKQVIAFRTAPAISANGDLAVGGAGGSLMGLSSAGGEYGPIDIPGVTTIFGKDGGVLLPSIGEFPPLVAADGAVLFGATEGVVIAYPSGLLSRVARCTGSLSTIVAGVAAAGGSAFALACADGVVQVYADAAPAPATSAAGSSASAPSSASSLPALPPVVAADASPPASIDAGKPSP